MTYEEAMARLEEIVGLLEEKKVSLSEAVDLYKEGAKLSLEIRDMLENAEGEVAKLGGDLKKEGFSKYEGF